MESANLPGSDFPIHNLPYGVFTRDDERRQTGVAIGDRILPLRACAQRGFFASLSPESVRACEADSLNDLLALGPAHWSPLRDRIADLLLDGTPETQANRREIEPLLIPIANVQMKLPAAIGDYTDFFASLYHAINVGSLFRPNDPVAPNYKYLPVGYHSRASSIAVSGSPVHRPRGQSRPSRDGSPRFGPCAALDYELEAGFWIGPGNTRGEAIPIGEAGSQIFGICLLNDWSARDIQMWETQPLGPFLSKSFATSISPWIVTMDALEPFRVPAFARPEGDPRPLAYLDSPHDQERGGIDLKVEVYLASEKMRTQRIPPMLVSRGNLRDLYWTPAQMVAHHTSNGCNLRPGDLLGSGTVSGPTPDSRACLIEMTRNGAEPITLPTGEQRGYLEDGDEVILRGYCERGSREAGDDLRIGLGECRGVVLAAR